MESKRHSHTLNKFQFIIDFESNEVMQQNICRISLARVFIYIRLLAVYAVDRQIIVLEYFMCNYQWMVRNVVMHIERMEKFENDKQQ